MQPAQCVPPGIANLDFASFDRILVVGGGKAGAAMTLALESALEARGVGPERVDGMVNVPNETVTETRSIRLHAARPMGTNQPTAAAQTGTEKILDLVAAAGPNDLLLCLFSGGGSALLPAPVHGVSLADKQTITSLLHRSGATIDEMNAVRKHLSRIKGGGLLRAFRGKHVVSLIISDVIGDPLDVIASGPTAVDTTTFAHAIAVLNKFDLWSQTPASIRSYLERGAAGQEPETLKQLPTGNGVPLVENRIIANNAMALAAAERQATALGYRVVNLGPEIAGDTRAVAESHASHAITQPLGTCILSGGETTVVLPEKHGMGGRNQEFVLAAMVTLGAKGMREITVLSGGTDGEDGPTDAAGAIADEAVWHEGERLGLDPQDYLARHDAYHFSEKTNGLIKTGLTHTNVMDLRVLVCGVPLTSTM